MPVPTASRIPLFCRMMWTAWLCVTMARSVPVRAQAVADSASWQLEADAVTQVAGNRQSGQLQQIFSRDLVYMPAPAGTIEDWVKNMPGVTSHSELSSQYAVRGGSFDENLVYVNGVEIYKPFLIRAGEQEGLTFVNPAMVSSLKFSAGGFDARYGDKMSSVLDVAYRRPERLGGSATLGLQTSDATLEGTSRQGDLTWLAGYRYKSARSLLSSLDTRGSYDPRFHDFQTYITWRMTPAWQLAMLGYVADNLYRFKPEQRETQFGTVDDMFRFVMYYDGQEEDSYRMSTGALTLSHQPSAQTLLKWMVSGTSMREKEYYDVVSSYLLDRLEADEGAPADSLLRIGVGSVWQHGRNSLQSGVISVQHLGQHVTSGGGMWNWGVQWQHDEFDDQHAVWEAADSAGYVRPAAAVLRGRNLLHRNRYSGYVQATFRFDRLHALWHVTAGLRGNWNDLNREWLLTPRASVSLYPKAWPAWSFHGAAGCYYQPPFYRELRDSRFLLHTGTRAQRSLHVVAEAEHVFRMWQRTFKWSGSLYYKRLNRLIPYKLENVRTVYAGENLSDGYAAGADLRLNGCFVPDAESWVSVSWLSTREDIRHDGHGSFPRPTDERFSVKLFFQDYFPGNNTWRVHLMAVYGTALPCSYPDEDRFDRTFRMRPYRRVDVGLSKDLGTWGWFRTAALQTEVFNLLDIRNTVSYLWADTLASDSIGAASFAVPNYLTGRHLNVKLYVTF